MSEIKNVMHVRANQPTCVCDLQLVKLLISLHFQCRTPVSNSCFHVLGTDYQHYENEETVSSICSVKVVILMSRIKGGTMRNGSPRYILARPALPPVLHWLLLEDVGHILALSSPSCSLSLLTRLRTPLPQICALLGCVSSFLSGDGLLELVCRVGSCRSNWSMFNYATLVPVVSTALETWSAIFLIELNHFGTPSHILHRLNWVWCDKVSSDKSCLFHGNLIICPN